MAFKVGDIVAFTGADNCNAPAGALARIKQAEHPLKIGAVLEIVVTVEWLHDYRQNNGQYLVKDFVLRKDYEAANCMEDTREYLAVITAMQK